MARMDTEIQALPENVDDLQRLLRELIGTTDALRSDVAAREDALAQTLRELATERKENDRLREQIRLYLQKQFGPSSEKLSEYSDDGGQSFRREAGQRFRSMPVTRSEGWRSLGSERKRRGWWISSLVWSVNALDSTR